MLAFPTDIHAYHRLSALLSLGNLRTEKGKCILHKADVYAHAQGMKFIIVPPSTEVNETFELEEDFEVSVAEYRARFGDNVYLSVVRAYDGHDTLFLHRLFELSASTQTSLVATNDVHYHSHSRRELHDILTCIQEKYTIQTAGFRLHANAERYLKPVDEMMRLFLKYPSAIWRTQEIADACNFSLDDLQYRYPKEINTSGCTPLEHLRHLTWEGAARMYGEDIPEKIWRNIAHEMAFIAEVNYAEYFLTVHDIVDYARSKGILCRGRGIGRQLDGVLLPGHEDDIDALGFLKIDVLERQDDAGALIQPRKTSFAGDDDFGPPASRSRAWNAWQTPMRLTPWAWTGGRPSGL